MSNLIWVGMFDIAPTTPGNWRKLSTELDVLEDNWSTSVGIITNVIGIANSMRGFVDNVEKYLANFDAVILEYEDVELLYDRFEDSEISDEFKQMLPYLNEECTVVVCNLYGYESSEE